MIVLWLVIKKMEIRNNNQLLDVMNNVIDQVTQEVADEVLDILYAYIEADVYDTMKFEPYSYNRTYEFLKSWVNEVERKGNRKEVIARIYSEPSRMQFNSLKSIHGSKEYGDIREYMSKAIQEAALWTWKGIRKDGTRNPASIRRPFFDDTIKYLNRNGKLKKIYEAKMRKYGLSLNNNIIR